MGNLGKKMTYREVKWKLYKRVVIQTGAQPRNIVIKCAGKETNQSVFKMTCLSHISGIRSDKLRISLIRKKCEKRTECNGESPAWGKNEWGKIGL